MDPYHPSNTSDVPGHAPPSNQPVLHIRAVNQSPLNHVSSHPQFQTQPQFMPQPQQQTSPSQLAIVPAGPVLPSINFPPYDDMICRAIRDLNEPNGSNKLNITRHIQITNPVLPPNHPALVTYHLRTLTKNGTLTMVNKSYKIAAAPESVAVAGDLGSPRSPINTSPLAMLAASASDLASASASQPQKRGRGRPPKAKPEAPQEQQPINAQPIAVLSRGQSSREQPELPTAPNHTESANRRGRPRRDGDIPNAPTAVLALPVPNRAEVMQRGMKRGPGRPPNISRNRPRKSATPMSTTEATGIPESPSGELKRKLNFACEKAKEIADLLKAGSGSDSDVLIAMTQARQEMQEGLMPMLTVEPHGEGQGQPHAEEVGEALAVEQTEAMEEVQPEEAMEEAQN